MVCGEVKDEHILSDRAHAACANFALVWLLLQTVAHCSRIWRFAASA